MPPFLIVAIGAIGAAAAAAARLLSRESRRVNTELDAVRREGAARRPPDGGPTLRRDPKTGEYRPAER